MDTSCSSGYLYLATCIWCKRGFSYLLVALLYVLTMVVTSYACALQGGFVTTSEVDVVVTERENDVIYQCHGTNEALGQTVVDTITLKVMCKFQLISTHCSN